jgi:sugar phosphate isomerase/epimerase
MRRRTFLAAGAAMAAPAAWPFGYSCKGFPGWPLERAFALCARLGYTGVEVVEPGRIDAGEVRALVRRHGLPVLSIMEDLRLTGDAGAQLERLGATLRLAREMGRPVVETVVGGRPVEWEQLRPQFAARLREWARVADRHKVTVAIKAHIGSALHRPEDAAVLCRETGSRHLRINYDYSHFQLQGMELEASLRAALPYIAMIHIKDSTGPRDSFRFALPGEGTIDYAAYTALLRRVGYRGPVVVEVSTHVLQRAGFDAEVAARQVAAGVGKHFVGLRGTAGAVL